MKTILHHLLGILTAFCLMFILLITSVEAVCYWTPDYYKNEYEKYQVLDDLPEMTMDDLLSVTDEMMAYLRGKREDLHVFTTMGGEYREFFTEREIAHMEDVKGLFLAAIALRRICLLLAAAAVGLIFFTKGSLKKLLPKTIFAGTLLFFAAAAVLGLIISTDFTKYFIIFHHIFFTNDLWMLDPSVDMLINIVPEPFFMDTTARILITFGLGAAAVLAVSFFLMRRGCRKKPHSGPLSLILALTLSLTAVLAVPQTAYAEVSWPEFSGISADGGILIDADSGAVLFEKNADQAYYPASITKILTALIIIENCDLDEMVTFSYNAVYNVESGSSNMGALDGDVLSVRDCLYGLMLASANECANALAEHCAGSVEAFAEMMNEKARELGCTGSHFANPSGLNDEDHYVTARDMAIIMKAALANPVFVEIDSALYWKHGPIKRYPDPDAPENTVYCHHSMLKKNDSRYYSGAFAGKTGYTSLAGNTLVTAAKRDGMTLICVILNGHQTHYQDTKALFDYGFKNFKTVPVSDFDQSYTSIENDMTIAGLTASPISTLSMAGDCRVTLPLYADFGDAETTLDYQTTPDSAAPDGAAARIFYTYAGRPIGSAWLTVKSMHDTRLQAEEKAAALSEAETIGIPEPTTKAMEEQTAAAETSLEAVSPDPAKEALPNETAVSDRSVPKEEKKPLSLRIPATLWVALAVTMLLAALITIFVLVKIHIEKKEEEERYQRRERRKKRLSDIGFSQADFDLLVEKRKRRSSKGSKSDQSNLFE